VSEDADRRRQEMLARWELAAEGWGRRAQRVRENGMPVSTWLIDHLSLQPGQRVLELAAGPGDTGFLAAELIRPGGALISSDGTEAMLEVARSRAADLGLDNVEFRRIELEWIDLPTATVDAVLCRWGMMLSLDPAAAAQEARRVLRPGGRIALAVWDAAERNPWATIPARAMVELGHATPPDPAAPGMFALAEPGALQELLESAGFVDVIVEGVDLPRREPSLEEYIAEMLDLSRQFGELFEPLSSEEREAVKARIASLAEPFTGADGALELPGRSLVAAAGA
jgi:SAM-dependent methyltransferase